MPQGRYWDLFVCSWVDCLPPGRRTQVTDISRVTDVGQGQAPAHVWVPAARTAPATPAPAPRVPG